MNTLYLASESSSRKLLLEKAKIPFTVISHNADEDSIPVTTVHETVSKIAQLKMKHVIIPDGKEGDVAYILTADSMVADSEGAIHGKPKDKDDVIRKIKTLRGDSVTATGFCLQKRTWKDNTWSIDKEICKTVAATCTFSIPDSWVDRYLDNSHAYNTAGAITIESYGLQFLEKIDGSFSTVTGLPLFEVREALEEVGFFNEV